MSAAGRSVAQGVDRIPVVQGETVLWAGRPQPRARLRDLSLQVAIPAAVGFVGMTVVVGDARAALGLVALCILFMGSHSAYALWRASQTRYALTERHLYTSWGRLPPRTTAVRLTALPRLELVDAERSFPSIVFRSPGDRSLSGIPTWLAPRPHVLLDSIPDARAILDRIETLRAEAASAPQSATAHPRPGLGSGRRLLSLYVLAFGVIFLAVAGFGFASLLLSETPGLVVPAILWFGPFAAVGLGLLGWQAWRVRSERTLARMGQLAFGVVTEIVEVPQSEAEPTWEVRYRYEVLGRRYTGRYGGLSFEEAHGAGLGETLLLRVDIGHPERSVWATS